MRTFLIGALALTLFAGCDSLGAADDDGRVPVVLAALEVDQPLPRIRLVRATPLDEAANPAEAAITDATLFVYLLGETGEVEGEFVFGHVSEGIYATTSADPVLGGRRYRLRAELADGSTLSAETVTPTAFSIAEDPQAVVPYQSGEGPEVRITGSEIPGRQSVYLIASQALAPDDFEVRMRADSTFGYERLFTPGRFGPTPFRQAILNNTDCDPVGSGFDCSISPADLVSGNSPLLNEESYVRNADGTDTVTIPWLAFPFYGPTQFEIIAVDDALKDLIEQQVTQGGGTTLSPGEIPNVIANVQGGQGYFGAFARVRTQVCTPEPGGPSSPDSVP